MLDQSNIWIAMAFGAWSVGCYMLGSGVTILRRASRSLAPSEPREGHEVEVAIGWDGEKVCIRGLPRKNFAMSPKEAVELAGGISRCAEFGLKELGAPAGAGPK